MADNLVIVESPAKAKTVERFLGRRYVVKASLGHVRDLPKSQLGVDVEGGFVPKYLVPKEKKQVVKDLKELVKSARKVYLATDPDREGEAISWHLLQAAGIDPSRVQRVVFHEITREAIEHAFQEPRQINMDLVQAQQARRILDRLVGYKLSPLLWSKVKGRLSAGRVQSVAVRMITDREREIEAFEPQEYWTVEAELAKPLSTGRRRTKASIFRAAVIGLFGEREKLAIGGGEQAQSIVEGLRQAQYDVAEIRERQVQRSPAAPFTTSTLQQEAYRKLRFTAKRTMMVAQQLYEGLPLGKEQHAGLITYMRTDSTQVAASAQVEARGYIANRFGADSVPEQPRVYTRKAKGAQEAHEAIRPTSVLREPDAIKEHLTAEQFKLYDLIWKRFVASQMSNALFDSTSVDIKAQVPGRTAYLLRATGSVLRFAGFLAVYTEGRDESDETEEEGKRSLPALTAGEQLDLVELYPEQHFTQPPPRYTDASLVRALDEKGIGRPSTYAPTLSTIQERGYVQKIDGRFQPTELGRIVNDLLVNFFPRIVDTEFTAQMEDELDEIAQGGRDWVDVLRTFYGPFDQTIQSAQTRMPEVKVADEPTGEVCEKCGRPMVIKLGRYGKFMACSGFPECRNPKPLLVKVGVACPQCGGEIVEKRARKRGRIFYGCSHYPTCNFTLWSRPVQQPCPECGSIQVLQGRRAIKCTQCEHTEAWTEEPEAARA